jgi:hypothetical protein
MELTELQYNVIMQAINNSYHEISEGNFIDPYSDEANMYTDEQLTEALKGVEIKLITLYTSK